MPEQGIHTQFFKDGDKERVEIRVIAGGDTLIKDVDASIIDRFPQEYAIFKDQLPADAIVGTSLESITGLSANACTNLRLKGVMSVEDLAGASDAVCSAIGMGGITWRKMALDFLKVRDAGDKDAQIAALTSRLEALEAKPKRGRPPKAEAA